MAVSLRKIAKHPASLGIELFREQTHVITVREQTLEQLARFVIAALKDVIVDEPEAARQKCTFTFGQAVAGIVAFVTQHEFAIDQQSVLDRAKRPLNARVARGKETDKGNQQQTGIEPLGAIRLHEAIQLCVKSTLTNFSMNFVRDLTPALAELTEGFRCHFICGAIERDPRHDL